MYIINIKGIRIEFRGTPCGSFSGPKVCDCFLLYKYE